MMGRNHIMRYGYTVIELMVTVLIVAALATVVGTFFVQLLTIQEKDREEAYIQEKLTSICGTFADYLSVGSAINDSQSGFDVLYRQEAGGISLETGRVAHVSKLTTWVNQSDNVRGGTIDFVAYAREQGAFTNRYSRNLRGDDIPLISLNAMKELQVINGKVSLSYAFTPFNASSENASLWHLKVAANYEVEDRNGERKPKTVEAERLLRLWNIE